MSNIRKAFENKKAFIPFVTCGDPNIEATGKIVRAMVKNGADLIELGIPFSDPTAEGTVIQGANIRALSKGITIVRNIPPDLYLTADETMLMRFFINLINNAITYGKPNGHIRLTLERRQDGIQGSLEDDGIGISPEHLEHIWERFYQVDSSRSAASGQGAGLGLPMVKWIIQAHGGQISVESKPGEGTAFFFFFPLFLVNSINPLYFVL